jgi:hypothetical protein
MKWKLALLLAGFAVGATGCAHVDVVAPRGQTVYLAPASAPLPVERRWRTWFLVWGYSPLDNTMPAEYIQREQLTQVRVVVEDNALDALHSFLYNVYITSGLVPQTLVLQGTRRLITPDPLAAAPIQSNIGNRP